MFALLFTSFYICIYYTSIFYFLVYLSEDTKAKYLTQIVQNCVHSEVLSFKHCVGMGERLIVSFAGRNPKQAACRDAILVRIATSERVTAIENYIRFITLVTIKSLQIA